MVTDRLKAIPHGQSLNCDVQRCTTARARRWLLAVVVIGCQQTWAALFAEDGSKTAYHEIDAMIDALANDNDKPELAHNSWIVLFPENYDWEEAERASRAFIVLAKDEREETWQELLNYLDDRRYAVTMANNGGYPRNYTVGALCRKIAYHRLCAAFEDELPVNELGVPVHPRLRLGDNLADWRSEHASKRLYELQIEVSQQAIQDIVGTEFLTLAARTESRKKIEKVIRRLRATRKPAFRKLPFDGYEWYSARRAAEMWGEYRNNKQKERATDCDGGAKTDKACKNGSEDLSR